MVDVGTMMQLLQELLQSGMHQPWQLWTHGCSKHIRCPAREVATLILVDTERNGGCNQVPTTMSCCAAVGDLSRMLPSEMALLAHGWPRRVADNPEGAAAAAAAGGQLVSLSSLGSQDEDGQIIEEQYYLPGE